MSNVFRSYPPPTQIRPRVPPPAGAATFARTASSITAALQATDATNTASPITTSIQAIDAARTASPVTATLQAVGTARQATPVAATLQTLGVARTATPVTATFQAIGTPRQATLVAVSVQAVGTPRVSPATAALQAIGAARQATPVTAALSASATATRTAPATASLQAVGSTRTATDTAALQAVGSVRTAPGTASLQAVGAGRPATPVTATVSLASTRTAPNTATLQAIGAVRTAPATASLQGASGVRTAPATAALRAIGSARTATDAASLQSLGTSRQATATATLQAFTAPAATAISPTPGSSSGTTVAFVWRTAADPTSRAIHSRVVAAASPSTLNTDGSLAAAVVDAHTAYQGGFEYDTSAGSNGAGPWVAYPSTGLTVANQGRQARYTATIPAGLTDWRCRLESIPVPPMNIFAPAYYWTNGMAQWDSLATGPHPERRIIVAGVDAVGGGVASTVYTNAITTARAAGARVLGYVHSNFGAATQAQMIADAQLFQSLYAIDGIFVDETITDAGHLAAYTAVANAIRAQPNQLVVMNPGGTPDVAYFAICDLIMTWEDIGANYTGATFPGWLTAYKSQCIHTPHTVAPANWPAMLALARTRPCAWIYITDDIMPNAYHLLPTYWTAFTAAVET